MSKLMEIWMLAITLAVLGATFNEVVIDMRKAGYRPMVCAAAGICSAILTFLFFLALSWICLSLAWAALGAFQ